MIASASNKPRMLTVFLVFISSSCPFDSQRMKRFQYDSDRKKCFSDGETFRIPVHPRKAPMVVLMGARNARTEQIRKEHFDGRTHYCNKALPQPQCGQGFNNPDATRNYRNSNPALQPRADVAVLRRPKMDGR